MTKPIVLDPQYSGNLRCYMQDWTAAEKAISEAMLAVEKMGGSLHLTNATMLLSQARQAVAKHVLLDSFKNDNWEVADSGFKRIDNKFLVWESIEKPTTWFITTSPGYYVFHKDGDLLRFNTAKEAMDYADSLV